LLARALACASPLNHIADDMIRFDWGITLDIA
jgi:hypothetical protein